MTLNVVKGVFKKYPWAANTFTYGCMCVGAEFSQQYLTKRVIVSMYFIQNCKHDSLRLAEVKLG